LVEVSGHKHTHTLKNTKRKGLTIIDESVPAESPESSTSAVSCVTVASFWTSTIFQTHTSREERKGKGEETRRVSAGMKKARTTTTESPSSYLVVVVVVHVHLHAKRGETARASELRCCRTTRNSTQKKRTTTFVNAASGVAVARVTVFVSGHSTTCASAAHGDKRRRASGPSTRSMGAITDTRGTRKIKRGA
jgi:hypothetical protein